MVDYHCHPLWEASLGQIGNIDPETLPISQDLKVKLIQWARSFDETLNMADPINSGFVSTADHTEFLRIGDELAKRLQSELGVAWAVYFSSAGTGVRSAI
jgi:hypothetical protein